MNKKKLLSLALVVIMIAILSFSTLAWFNDADEVTNRFYVASSDDTEDSIFSVDVYEEVDRDGDGEPEKEQAGLEFSDVVPGQVLPKAPVVENTGKYDQWIKLTITFSTAKAWETLSADVGHPIDLLTLANGFDTNWTFVEVKTENGVYEYTYYLNRLLTPGETVDVFTAVNIPGERDQADFVEIKDETITLNIKADAIQKELGDTAAAAFAALAANP